MMNLPPLPPLPEPRHAEMPYYFDADMKTYAEQYGRLCAEAEREACAKLCEELEVDFWKLFKSRHEVGSGREHTEGKSDGATECAAAIRARSK